MSQNAAKAVPQAVGLTDQARDQIARAEDYAARAMAGVLDRLDEDARRPNRLFRHYARLTLGLEVHFMFPTLSAGERRLLVQLLEARNAVIIRRAVAPGSLGSARRGAQDRRMRTWSQRYRKLRAAVVRLQQRADLNGLQKSILRGVFLQRPD